MRCSEVERKREIEQGLTALNRNFDIILGKAAFDENSSK
jgi:hypothetical protein